ncbi:MAG: 4'-phosphopantetheinyl transferase superfamily protein [Tenacibaculum sp.]|nr:4'-phosphopantetheinyl transferase superfamily protein [Tenacibaculum sp.]
MPLYKTIKINTETTLFIWEVTESLEDLQSGIQLTENNKIRLKKMKSELHKKAFLGVRHLFKIVGYNDDDIIYDEFGKPHLKDRKYISITHSFNFCGIIISKNKSVGIDIEKQREKIINIAHKFTPINEYKNLSKNDLTKKLTIVWGAKESLYKIYGKKEISLLKHIHINNFKLSDNNIFGRISFNNDNTLYSIKFIEFSDFICVYALKN